MLAPTGAEDPISSIFDLADRAAQMAPRVRRLYLGVSIGIGLFLAILVYLLFTGLSKNTLLSVLALVAVAFGLLALVLLGETDRFYRTFVERHRRIRLLLDAEPTPAIPKASTPMQRLARYLVRSSPRLASAVSDRPGSVRFRVRIAGERGAVPFDLAIVEPSPWLYRWFRLGPPGFTVLARLSPDAPSVADLEAFGSSVRSVARRLPAPISRAILLRLKAPPLSEEVYEYAVGHPLELDSGAVALEIISEGPTGTYDLVPHVLGIP